MHSISSQKLLTKLTEIDGVRSAAILEGTKVKAVLAREGASTDGLRGASDAVEAVLSRLPAAGWESHSFTFYCEDAVTCVLALEHHAVVLIADRTIRLPLLEVSFQMVAQILETSTITYSSETAEA